MAEDKKSFLLYTDLIHTVNKMPNDKAGELFKHILSYVNDLNPETEDLIIELTFEPIKQQLKRDLLKYKESIIDKSNAGKLGNLKRWNKDLYDKVVDNQLDLQDALNIAESRKVSHTDNVQSQPIAEIAVNDNVNVNDKVINNIDSRKTSFANSIKPFLETYGKEMCTEFYKYWTEHGEKDKKMRFERGGWEYDIRPQQTNTQLMVMCEIRIEQFNTNPHKNNVNKRRIKSGAMVNIKRYMKRYIKRYMKRYMKRYIKRYITRYIK
jgi:hypothetical protein